MLEKKRLQKFLKARLQIWWKIRCGYLKTVNEGSSSDHDFVDDNPPLAEKQHKEIMKMAESSVNEEHLQK